MMTIASLDIRALIQCRLDEVYRSRYRSREKLRIPFLTH